MSAAFTPGPWTWQEDQSDRSAMPRLVSPSGEVCNFGNCERYYPTEGTAPSDDDMRLISAAPDLLAALIWFVENDDTNEGMPGNEYWEAGLNAGRAAIAKATGEAS